MSMVNKSAMRAVILCAGIVVLCCFSPPYILLDSHQSASVSSPANLVGNIAANESSLNWAGYAVTAQVDSVTRVRGSWIEPSVSCPVSSTPEAAVFWVGIDGFASSTVEQTGTIAECLNGVASYSAWYEFYPNSSVFISTLTI